MTRRPVTVTEDQLRLIEGATVIGPRSSRSAVVRNAFREFFGENEVLLAVLIAQMDDVEPRDVISAVDADREAVYDILERIDDSVERAEEGDILENIGDEFRRPDIDDAS